MKDKIIVLIEPLIVFAAFFLPGYVMQTDQIDPALFDSVQFNIAYILTGIPQIALLLYLMLVTQSSSSSSIESPAPSTQRFRPFFHNVETKLRTYSIERFQPNDLLIAFLLALGMYGALALLSFGVSLFYQEPPEILRNPVAFTLSDATVIPLVFLTCIVTGYREEMMFRNYFLSRCEMADIKPVIAVLFTTLLFSSGHIYQGVPGFFGTLLIGIFFSIVFYKTKNLHIIAIAHGLFNFVNLLMLMQ